MSDFLNKIASSFQFFNVEVQLFYVQVTSCLGHSVVVMCPAPAKTRIKLEHVPRHLPQGQSPLVIRYSHLGEFGTQLALPWSCCATAACEVRPSAKLYLAAFYRSIYIWSELAYIGISWPSWPGIWSAMCFRSCPFSLNWRSAYPVTEDSDCLVHRSNLYMSCQFLFVVWDSPTRVTIWSWKVVRNVGHLYHHSVCVCEWKTQLMLRMLRLSHHSD